MKKRNFAAIAAVLFVLCASACGGYANTNPVQIEATEEEKNVLPDELAAIEIEGAREIIAERYGVIYLKATISDGTEIEWVSGNESAAIVNGDGAVLLVGSGSAVITARKKTDKKISASVLIRVLPKTEETAEDIFDEK